MIYKSINIKYYPEDLGDLYECIITDQRQDDTIGLLSTNKNVYLYDIVNANNTSINNNNTVTISLSKNSGNINLSGYSYVSNSIITTEYLDSATSTEFTILNFRDPDASITIYGGGNGQIISTSTNYSEKVQGGRTFTLKASYTISRKTFNYPNNQTVEVTVTPSYSGSGNGLQASNLWTHYWNVKLNGAKLGLIEGNGNTGNGTFTFSCPLDTKWTVSPPTVEVYCSLIQASYTYRAGGYIEETTYFKCTSTITGDPLDENLSGVGGYVAVYAGTYEVYRDGSYPIICKSGTFYPDPGREVEYSYVRVNGSYGTKWTEEKEVGGTTYSGMIEYRP